MWIPVFLSARSVDIRATLSESTRSISRPITLIQSPHSRFSDSPKDTDTTLTKWIVLSPAYAPISSARAVYTLNVSSNSSTVGLRSSIFSTKTSLSVFHREESHPPTACL